MAGSPFTIDSNPTIRIRSPSHHHHISPHPASPAGPMSIPGSSHQSKSPPPPLPPPKFVQGFSDPSDPGFQFANAGGSGSGASDQQASTSIRTGSSLLGGHLRSSSYSGPKKNIDFGQSDTRASPINESAVDTPDSARSDQRIPDLAALLEYNKLQGDRMGKLSNNDSSSAYDKQVLSRIGGPRTPPRSAGGADQPGTPNPFTQLNGQRRPLTLPDRRPSEGEGHRWAPNPGSATQPFSPGLPSLKSPMSEHPPSDRNPRRTSHSFADGRSQSQQQQPPYEQNMFADHEEAVDDSADASIKAERSPVNGNAKAGQKRRAESPPSETIDPNLRGGHNNSNGEWSQRQPPSSERHSQAARLHDGQQAASLSSNVSSLPSHVGSYASSYGLSNPGTAATSYSSDRPSPSSYQQQTASGAMHPPSNPHQPQLLSQQAPNAAPPMPPRQMGSGMIRPPGVFICECCPKKPKKFESEQDLRNHEAEKQYVCHYCHNRFKNKNEAERHQNSLHLRRHSWSCAALQSFENAFHPSSNPTLATAAAAHAAATSTNPPSYPPPAATDTCGYCGQDFPNPPDWDARVEHLNHVHKFGECNQAKKFFRADHFRQHLKHSHGGTSGRWTNMLENACMREEAPPQPISQPGGMQMGGLPSPMSVMPPQQPPMQVPTQGAPQAQMGQMMQSPTHTQSLGQRLEQQSQQAGSS